MYRGRHSLGTEVPLSVLCTDASDLPVAPDAAPKIEVYAVGSKVAVGRAIPAIDRFQVTGLFGYRLFLSSSFSAGNYFVTYRWKASSHHGMDFDTFEVVAGGNSDGACVALHYYHRPHADFLVAQLDGGELTFGRNPKF